MVATTLDCPSCAAPLDVPPERTQFFCSFCGATVIVPESLRSGPTPTRPDDDAPLEPPPDLSRFEIDKQGSRLRIGWAWRSPMVYFLLPFSIFWCGFAVFWTVMATAIGGPFGLFGLPFVVIGMGLLYFAVGILVNRTDLRIEDGRLTVEHGPLPWTAPDPIEADNVRQVYVEEKVHHGKNGSRQYTYEVQALLHDGGKTKLVTEYKAPDARAIERMIEVHLGIEDRAVRGEYAA